VVARLGSFSAAARELAVAPSVVTKRITRLEERMRTRLIVRSTRGLALTAAGERFLPRFMRVVAEVEDLFIGCTSDGHWRRFCETFGFDEWRDDPRLAGNELATGHRQCVFRSRTGQCIRHGAWP